MFPNTGVVRISFLGMSFELQNLRDLLAKVVDQQWYDHHLEYFKETAQ